LCRLSKCVRANTLAETLSPDGRPIIWAGTHGGGLGRLSDDEWTVFSTSDGLPSDNVWGILEEPTAQGSVLWVGTEMGLAVLRPGADRFVTEPGFPTHSVNSLALTFDPKHERILWVGTYGGGLAVLKNESWARLTTAEGMPSNFFTSLVTVTPTNGPQITWAGTDGGGVVRITEDSIETIATSSGLPSDAVYSLLETRETDQRGMLWVGTRNGGLAQLVEGKWRKLSPDPRPLADPVNALLETLDENGSSQIWLGTDGKGLYRFGNGRWTHFAGKPPSDTIQCLAEGRGKNGKAEVWVGTRNGGLGLFSDGRWRTFSKRTGALPSDLVQALLTTRESDGEQILWVGTRHGLARFGDGQWSRFTPADGLPHQSILSLTQTIESNGRARLWAGTFNGLTFHDGQKWQTIEPSPGLLNNSVQCLHEHRADDGRRTLWAGTDGGGLTILDLDNGAKVLFSLTDSTQPALPNNVISEIVEDRFGRIYCLTNGGVARLTMVGPNSGRATDYEILTYSMEDGLPLNEGNRGAAIVDRSGKVWVGTVGGAAVIDPRIEQPDQTNDPLILEARPGSDPTELLSSGVDLSFSKKHIVFSYALLSFFHEDRTRFKTQLVGLPGSLSPWTTDTKTDYRALSSGHYIFRVWGRDAAGNTSDPLEFAFSVLPPPWQTWWAYALMMAFATLGVSLILRARIRAIRERERRLSKLVEARTRRLTEANQLLVELSYADSLTGVGNRRRFDELYVAEWRRAIRAGQPLSLIIFDVDLLKVYNDTFGHAKGDECLKAVAAAVADSLPRAGDTVSRFGGDEFAVILPGTKTQGAVIVAENLRRAVAGIKLKRGGAVAESFITVTCGVGTQIPTEADDPNHLIDITDKALYLAKNEGRNRVGTAQARRV
ncbi:MAG: diguanylate cyclase, partial [Thermoanaerobaculales bacterium]|nr:diguanylate cyclase [Thermoanaerobaculales bacterium]